MTIIMLTGILHCCLSNVWIVLIVLTVFLYIWWSRRARSKLPPFPATPLPIVGNLLSLEANPRKVFEKWTQQHGDVFSVYMGQTLVIFVNRYDAVKEALVTYGDYFSDRPTLFIDRAMDSINCGVVTSSGEVWQEQRSVTFGILKQLGMGKNILAEKIQEEADHLILSVDEIKDSPVDLVDVLYVAVANIICAIVIGKRQRYDDPKFQILVDNLRWLAKNVKLTNPLHFLPELMHIPGDLFKGKEIQRRLCQCLDHFSEYYIKENESDDSGEHFIAMYLKKCRLDEERGVMSTLSKKNLARIIFDLLAGGTESSSSTILWFILQMIHNPKIQETIQAEIDTHVGANRKPNISDKPRLPYLNASIMETQRLSSVIPLSITHLCSETVQFRGYTIPKEASIAPNLDSVLFDKETWGEDADVFRPERHLDESGNLVIRPEFIPFSIGKRYCLGDSIAKMELYLFTSAMLQKFTFLPEVPDNLPTTEEIFGITCSPHPFKARILER